MPNSPKLTQSPEFKGEPKKPSFFCPFGAASLPASPNPEEKRAEEKELKTQIETLSNEYEDLIEENKAYKIKHRAHRLRQRMKQYDIAPMSDLPVKEKTGEIRYNKAQAGTIYFSVEDNSYAFCEQGLLRKGRLEVQSYSDEDELKEHILESVQNFPYPFDIPDCEIGKYLDRIKSLLEIDHIAIFIYATILADRYLLETRDTIRNENHHALIATSLLVSSKLLFDDTWAIKYYAAVFGFDHEILKQFETQFVHTLGWGNLDVSPEQYKDFENRLLLKTAPEMKEPKVNAALATPKLQPIQEEVEVEGEEDDFSQYRAAGLSLERPAAPAPNTVQHNEEQEPTPKQQGPRLR